MKVDVFSLKKQYEDIKDEIKGPVEKVVTSGGFILGEDVKLFEQEFPDYCGVKHGVGVNSGTDALFLACLACGIGKGDEVIVMPYTYIATALGISMAGARPVFVDIEEKTYNIDVSKIEKAITEKTKAILNTVFPDVSKTIQLHVPDEQSRRVGQAVAAASLPRVKTTTL